ncbi:MAG TPA: GNAT family N-acetyltransferase [Acidimicrobiales bacterium]|nr:GNAT family N-acetyltransferase [Acidimicrobiales bacterium]
MTERAEVTVTDHAGRERFEALVGEHVAGWITYGRDGEVVDMQHTVVGDEYEGQGVGSALVRGALDQVREAGQKVRATCPFVKSFIEDHQEYADLVG